MVILKIKKQEVKITQEDILQLLEENKELTTKDIANMLEISFDAVRKNLRGLLRGQEVEKRTLTKQETETLGKRFSGRGIVWRISKEE